MIKQKRCKVCGGLLFEKPILVLNNMPKGAQSFLKKEELSIDRGVDLELYQCSCCGLIQLTREPVPYYKEVIRAVAFSEEMKTFRRHQFKEFLEKYGLVGKKILEVGCGKGEFMEIMKECGADVYGIEYGEENVRECLKKGLKVERDFISSENYKVENAPFDGFYILNFLEHIPYPVEFLRGIAFNLKDGGIGLVEVPNFEMCLKNKIITDFIPDHIFYFTLDTLELVLKMSGFKMIEKRFIYQDKSVISVVVKKREKIDLTEWKKNINDLRNSLENFLKKYKKEEVMVWGAGHQALAILSLTGISSKIRGVVDSAPFKQGKFTPVSHLPIYSPEVLNKFQIKAVIVMVGPYSSEVVKILKTCYKKIKIAVVEKMSLKEL